MRRLPSFLPVALAFAVLAWAPATARAEAPKAPPGSLLDPTSVGAGLDLSVDSLQERAKKLEASGDQADESVAAALRDYRAAIDQLHLAAEWKQRADALARLADQAPRLLDGILTQMETWSKQAPAAVGESTTLSELEAMLAETDAKLAAARKGLAEVDAEQSQIAQRRLSLPAELAGAGAVREGLLGEVVLPPLPVGSIDATIARRAVVLATRRAAIEQVAALELELSTYETRRELLTARRDLLRRQADAWSAQVTVLQAAIAERRAKEAEEIAAEARADQASLAKVHPILGALTEENARLAAERTGAEGLGARIDAASRDATAVADQLRRLDERAAGVRQKVAAAGLTDAIGLLLRKESAELPDSLRTRANIRGRRADIAAVQLRVLELEDSKKALPQVESEVEAILGAQGDDLAPDVRRRVESSARNVLKTRRGYIDSLIRDYNALFASLVDLDAKEAQLATLVDDYSAFLQQHVLWIPNASLPSLSMAPTIREAAVWLVDPANHVAVARRVVASARTSPLKTALALLALAGLLLNRRRLKALYASYCRDGVPEGASLPAPVAVGLVAVLLALPGPMLLGVLSWLLRTSPLPHDDFANATAVVLSNLVPPLFVAEVVRRACGVGGPAEAFLQWPRKALADVRAQVLFLETVALPAFLVAGLLDRQPVDAWGESLGRAAFCFGVGAIGLAMQRALGRGNAVVGPILKRTDFEWLGPSLARLWWLPGAVAVALVAIALTGYQYTAFVLLRRTWLSFLVLLLFLVANSAALRWLAAREEAPADGAGTAGEPAVPADGSLSRVSAQTRSLLRVLFGLGFVLGVLTVWADVFPALRYFEKIELWQVSTVVEKTVGTGEAAHVESVAAQAPVTMANLLLAVLGAALAVVGARNVPGLLELTVLSRLRLDRGLRYAIATVTRYLVFVAGAVMALSNLGVEWSSVQWLVAAVSVGLGFGLQEIFGNFVSGLIVLFERPVRVGDTVTIDGMTGTVSRIEIRATTIVDFDRRELIVPNKELITGKLVNWSLHDPVVRLVVEVGVAYGSDTATVERLLLEIAKGCPTVLENPAPVVVFMRFGDSSLNFELRVYLVNADASVPTRHHLMMDIERRFRAAGIELPYPQRDVHVRSVEPAVAATLTGRDGEGA